MTFTEIKINLPVQSLKLNPKNYFKNEFKGRVFPLDTHTHTHKTYKNTKTLTSLCCVGLQVLYRNAYLLPEHAFVLA